MDGEIIVKKIKIAAAIVGVVILLINGVWFAYWCSFIKYKNAVGFNGDYYGTTDSQGYRYEVFSPKYMNFSGNLVISNLVLGDGFTETRYGLYIWKSFTGKYEFGIRVYIPDEDDPTGLSYGFYEFLVDETGKLLSTEEYSSEELQVFEKSKDDIALLLKKSNDMWEIGLVR